MTPPRTRFVRGRYYWQPAPAVRRLGFAACPLGADQGRADDRAREINARVDAALAHHVQTTRPLGPVPHSVAHAIRVYGTSEQFQQLAPRTRYGYLALLSRVEAEFGQRQCSSITAQDLRAIYAAVKPKSVHVAKQVMVAWMLILNTARMEGWISESPAHDLKLTTPPSRTARWTLEQVTAFMVMAVAVVRRSIALAVLIAYETSQRQGDILRLSWSAWDGDSLIVRQSKRGALVRVPATEPLRQSIEETPRIGTQIIVSETTQRPYLETDFQHQFARIRAATGIPGSLQFRDLRRTNLTEAGERGATIVQLRAASGHANLRSVEPYIVPSADAARAAVEIRERGRTTEQARRLRV